MKTTPPSTVPAGTAAPLTPPDGHHGHHPPRNVFPGQPPAHVLPKPVGPGVTQPVDIPDTAKGSPLPHWDGVLIGSVVRTIAGFPEHHLPILPKTVVLNAYVNGAFNYGDFSSVEQALAAVKELTAPSDKPAAVIWKDKFNIVHAQALLSYGGLDLGEFWHNGTPIASKAPQALHLAAGDKIALGHPEALYVVDGDIVHKTTVPETIPVPGNGGAGWKPGGES